MGLFNWLFDGAHKTGGMLPAPPPEVAAAIKRQLERDIARRRGSNPQAPPPGSKPEPPAGPPESWVDPAKEKRSAELAEQLGLSPQGRSKPQPSGGRLFVNGIEQPRPARREQGFDVERLADRLDELADFVTQGPGAAEPYHDAGLVISAAASLLRNRSAANHRSLLEADLRAWYKNKYGEPYFGAIPITVAIEWAQHLLQQHAPPGEKPEFPPPRKIREGFLP